MYEIGQSNENDELFSRVCGFVGLWHRTIQGSPSEKFVGTAHWSISRLFDRSNGRNDRNQNTIMIIGSNCKKIWMVGATLPLQEMDETSKIV